jgi:hypothetical protein
MSALPEKFNPWNIDHLPVVKFFTRLDLNQILRFLNGRNILTACRLMKANVTTGPESHSYPGRYSDRFRDAYFASRLRAWVAARRAAA